MKLSVSCCVRKAAAQASKLLKRRSSFYGLALAASVVLLLGQMSKAEATEYYVSLNGNNTTGDSWTNAYSEMNKVNWSKFKPGDLLWLDGGTSQMVYHTPLTVQVSGTSSASIYIFRAIQQGHNGQVVIDGSGSGVTRLSTASVNPAPAPSPTPSSGPYGINIGNNSYVYINGMGVNSSWKEGILVRNWRIAGTYIGPQASNSLLVFLDLSLNNAYGLYNAGIGTGVQNSYIHDNRVYNVVKVEPQSGTSRFEMTASWISNSDYSKSSYGLMIANPHGNSATGSLNTLLYDCIFGPALVRGVDNQGLPYGMYLTHSLMLDSTLANVVSKSKCLVVLVTSYMTKHNINGNSHNAVNLTSDSTVEGNLVYQGNVVAPAGTNWYNTGLPNYQYNTTGNTTALSSKEISPPIFVQDAQISTYDGRVAPATLAATDFTIASNSVAAGSGPDSNATSVNALLQFLLGRGEGPP